MRQYLEELDPLMSQMKMEISMTVQNNLVKIKYIILKYLNHGIEIHNTHTHTPGRRKLPSFPCFPPLLTPSRRDGKMLTCLRS